MQSSSSITLLFVTFGSLLTLPERMLYYSLSGFNFESVFSLPFQSLFGIWMVTITFFICLYGLRLYIIFSFLLRTRFAFNLA